MVQKQLSNTLVRGMVAAVGSRGEVASLSQNTDLPILVRVVSYNQQTSVLEGKYAWAPQYDFLITALVVLSKSNGQQPAGEFCKLQENDLAFVTRKRKDAAPEGTMDPRDYEWFCSISGNGIICEVPIYITRLMVTPDCTQVVYEDNLRSNIANPPFDSDYPPASYFFMTTKAICWAQFNIQSGQMDKVCQKWPELKMTKINLPDPSGVIKQYHLIEYVRQIGANGVISRPQ